MNQFINKTDQIRKLGDLIAMIIFFILSFQMYIYQYYKISLLLMIFGIFDLVFTIDAIQIHGCQLFNLTNLV